MQPVIVGEIGSYAHGLATEHSDHDYMGIYIDPPACLIGLKPEQGVVKDRDKPDGVKSAPGDSEAVFYGLRKYVALATQGNPTIMTLLFTPTLTVPDQIGLQTHRDMFLSRQLTARHIGYADSMADRISGRRAPRTNRPELIAAHGYDTKAAFHAIRLLIQGAEMLTTGNITMPMTDMAQDFLKAIRNGHVAQDQTLEEIRYWRSVIVEAEKHSPLPAVPDYDRINAWLIDTHTQAWNQRALTAIGG